VSANYCSLKMPLAIVLSLASCIWAGINNTLTLSFASGIKTFGIDTVNFIITTILSFFFPISIFPCLNFLLYLKGLNRGKFKQLNTRVSLKKQKQTPMSLYSCANTKVCASSQQAGSVTSSGRNLAQPNNHPLTLDSFPVWSLHICTRECANFTDVVGAGRCTRLLFPPP